MNPIVLHSSYNYIAAFLTLRCNRACPYCINKHGEFKQPKEMNKEDWLRGLSRIKTRNDLPITFQGGEPTIYKDFYEIARLLHAEGKYLDVLTNGEWGLSDFEQEINPEVFKREAPYASIRISYHGQQGNDLAVLLSKIRYLHNMGYSVGLWGLSNQNTQQVANLCKGLGIDFRVKEYLDDKHGTYKYPRAVGSSLVKHVHCKPSELLIAPDGRIYRCHADLYASRGSIAHILDTNIKFPGYLACDNFGQCNPCDVKLKTNRLQEKGHCSVTIKEMI